MARSPERIFEFLGQEKVTEAKSGEYGCWAMTFVSCLAKNLIPIRLECDGALASSSGDALYTQNMNHVLSRSIRDIESLCYLSNANSTIFEQNFLHFFDIIVVNRGGWTTCMRQDFYDLTILTEYFIPLKSFVLDRVDSPKHFCNIFNDSVAVIPLETQNFKQTRCSIIFP